MYISSHHEYGKLIFTLSKVFKNMSVKELDKVLASLVHDLQVYITSYISYQQISKIDIKKVKDLIRHISSQEMELFSTSILIKTTFTTFFNVALIIDSDLSADPTKFSNILLSLATTTSEILYIPLEEILQMQNDFSF